MSLISCHLSLLCKVEHTSAMAQVLRNNRSLYTLILPNPTLTLPLILTLPYPTLPLLYACLICLLSLVTCLCYLRWSIHLLWLKSFATTDPCMTLPYFAEPPGTYISNIYTQIYHSTRIYIYINPFNPLSTFSQQPQHSCVKLHHMTWYNMT